MIDKNPYTLIFGKEPYQFIARSSYEQEIIKSFTSSIPTQQIFVISGVRGVGKTVFLTTLKHNFEKLEDWIVVELNPNRDLLSSLAAKLSSENKLAELFKRAKINLSFFGLGLEVSDSAPITDIEVAVEKMLQSIKRHHKRVLIAIDEVSNTQTMREFASAFQMFVRQDLPVFLLATGLYENVRDLQNTDNLTFLYRAPKIELGPLNTGSIISNYESSFNIDHDKARQMAKLTLGYSFAFQVLGYLTWLNAGDYQASLPLYRQYLDEYVYEKIWSELSAKDREVIRAIAKSSNGKIIDIRNELNMTSNQFNPYRKRLLDKGIIDGSVRGFVHFTLPLFGEFSLDQFD